VSVSVLIVNYRVYDDLTAALRSLDPFLAPGDEVIVFDQASDEDELAKVRAACPRVTLLASRENPGTPDRPTC
jgi:GT2 family glycosyltransferase